MADGSPHAFPATRQSLVRAIGSANVETRTIAYDTLVRSYWRPVYAYIRVRWNRDAEDARDLAQEFFTRDFEKAYLARFDPSRARFRTFLRTCLDAFLANERQASLRLKRGGDVTFEPLDAADIESDISAHPRPAGSDPERCFHDEWVRALFTAALADLRARCGSEGRTRAFEVLTRYDLDEAAGTERPSYAMLAAELDIKTTDVTNQLAWARRAFREAVLARLRRVCATEEEYKAEARALLGVCP